MNAAIYARVSTDAQAGEDRFSIPEQLSRCRAYCEAHDINVIDEYVDPGFSGASLDRPALKSMLSDIEAGKVDAVVVYKLDRLSRSQKDTLHVIEDVLMTSDCAFVSLSESLDTSTAWGRAQIGLLSCFAQLERENIKERTRIGKVGRAKSGKYHGGSPPIGYRFVDGKLVINEDEAPYVREVFARTGAGESVTHILADLKARGVRIRGKEPSLPWISRLPFHQVFAGRVTFEGETYEGMHEPLIDPEEFDRIQKVAEARKAKFSPSMYAGKHVLSGLIICGRCGGKFLYYDPPELKVPPRWRCQVRSRNVKNCQNRLIFVSELDELVKSEILGLKFTPDETQVSAMSFDASAAKKRLAKLKTRKKRLLELYSNESVDIETLEESLAEIAEAEAATADEIERTERMVAEQAEPTFDADVIKARLASAEHVLEHGTFADKRELLHALIERIVIHPDRIEIEWKFR